MALFGNDLSRYRPRFVDVRIRPGLTAQINGGPRCGFKGCDMLGDCKVARHVSRPGVTGAEGRLYDWFCERHAAGHNRSYNFFDSLSEDDCAAFWTSERTGHRPSWTFGAAGTVHVSGRMRQEHRRRASSKAKLCRTRLQLRSFEALDLPPDAAPGAVRERYANLVKVYHPDANGGDRSMEERLARVIKAFKILKHAKLA